MTDNHLKITNNVPYQDDDEDDNDDDDEDNP